VAGFDATIEAIVDIARREPGLELLALFGSRARGDSRDDSDVDLAYSGDRDLDALGFRARMQSAVGGLRVDLVDLDSASGVLRFHAARDGRVLFESRPGRFDEFWWQTVQFWCDAEPVLREAWGRILDRPPG
jgi:predicted nucleotidyltransferase